MAELATILSTLEKYLNDWTPWIAWKAEVFIFLICFFCFFLGGLAIADLKMRSRPRKGFLPFPTTRGDRIFVGIMLWIIVILAICAAGLPSYLSLIIGIPLVILIVLKG